MALKRFRTLKAVRKRTHLEKHTTLFQGLLSSYITKTVQYWHKEIMQQSPEKRPTLTTAISGFEKVTKAIQC